MRQTSPAFFLVEAEVISDGNGNKQKKCEQKIQQLQTHKILQQPGRKLNIVWRNVVIFAIMHAIAIYSMYLCFFVAETSYTIYYYWFLGIIVGMGITAGAHRLWAHQCYKATWQLRTILMVLQTMAFQNHIYEWVRDHRVHHKFTDTDADPHNSKRGFFFSHIGWLMVRKHEDVREKGKTVDMSDMEHDPVVMWQKKYYLILVPLFSFIGPTIVPCYFWGEQFWISFLGAIGRYILSLNFTWLVNSAAHMWGMRPYDKTISARENIAVATLTMGEGWHNYHHAFPWDYKAAELGDYTFNYTNAFINFFAWIGWAYDLKTATPEMIARRAKRTGDGSFTLQTTDGENEIWGWDDEDMSLAEKNLVHISHRES